MQGNGMFSVRHAVLATIAFACFALITFKLQNESRKARPPPRPFIRDGDGSLSATVGTGVIGRLQEAVNATSRKPEPAEVFDMSFPGFPAICNNTVPTVADLQAMTTEDGIVEMTHTACCDGISSRRGNDNGPRTICRIAPKPLRIPLILAKAALASGERTVDLNKLDLLRSLLFITGASGNHFGESLIMLKSVQTYFPSHRVLYWDLGLTADQAATIKTLCGVTYRRFNSSKYPPHVATLMTYAFKPLVIMESFSESHPILWWVDASIRFNSSDIEHVLELMKERHGIVMYREPNHSVWSTTYPQTYEYMATDIEGLKTTVTAAGCTFLVANTREVFSTVLFWFYACMLDPRCIAPIMYPEGCDLRGMDYFSKCHRFDQSVLTILVANIWGFISDGYRFNEDMFIVDKRDVGDHSVKRCDENSRT